jgi:hypothetical protein
MYFLQYRILPTEGHPEAELLGEGLVCCWIERDTIDEADSFARAEIARDHWQILERETAITANEDDFTEDEDFLGYYRQALTDREVLVFTKSPRFPVYWVIATVAQDEPPKVAEAHHFVSAEAIADPDEDIYDPTFWNEERAQHILSAVKESISETGWSVTEIRAHRPCSRSDVPAELQPYYDDAEMEGLCLVFAIDEPEEEEEADGQ